MSYLAEHDAHRSYRADVYYLSNVNGSVQVERCESCGYLEVQCEHRKNTWHDKAGEPISFDEILRGDGRVGVTLLCDLCGDDGT